MGRDDKPSFVQLRSPVSLFRQAQDKGGNRELEFARERPELWLLLDRFQSQLNGV